MQDNLELFGFIKKWKFLLLFLEMFQSELTLELERVLKSQLLNQSRVLTSTEILTPGNAESSFEVVATEHADNTRFPSDVLIDIKEMLKFILLKNVNPGKKAVRELLEETRIILEGRQVRMRSVVCHFFMIFWWEGEFYQYLPPPIGTNKFRGLTVFTMYMFIHLLLGLLIDFT